MNRLSTLVLLSWLLAAQARASTVWTGPLLTYNQPAPDPTQATNQDRVTPVVWLTRAASGGLFNAFSETNATALSPADTEWAFGLLTNYAAISYTNWNAWLNGQSPTNAVGKPAVVHLVSEDIYLSLELTFWASHGAGGFTYQRSTAPTNSTTVSITSPAVANGQFSFTYSANPGSAYVVRSSSNLVNWLPLQTNIAATNAVLFTVSFVSNQNIFYRVGLLTSP